MTREEAKEVFFNRGFIKVDGGIVYNPNKWVEACAIISDWLKQEPCEDIISRKELYNALYEEFHDEYAPNNITRVDLGAVRNFVKDFPPAIPARKKGKWINIDKTHSRCDRCESVFEIASANGESNFCPNCGAEMESEE